MRLNGRTRHGRTSAGCTCGKKVRGVPKLRGVEGALATKVAAPSSWSSN